MGGSLAPNSALCRAPTSFVMLGPKEHVVYWGYIMVFTLLASVKYRAMVHHFTILSSAASPVRLTKHPENPKFSLVGSPAFVQRRSNQNRLYAFLGSTSFFDRFRLDL